MSGIEFYPQKEFDEDMEDKSDNDKIRVRGALICCFLDLSLLLSELPPLRECQGTGACFVTLFLLINLVRLSLVRGTMLKCLHSTGDHALCRGGQRQRISSQWKTNSGEEDSVGNR